MSNDPEQIRQEIETTRMELSTDVDALAYKASPRRMATDRIDRARGRLGRIKDKVMGTATKARHDGGAPAAEARHRLSDTAHQASGAVSGAKDRASHAASSVAHQASGAVSGAKDRTSHAASSMAQQAQTMPQMTRERTEGNPLAVGLIAFGVGWLASSLIPPSRGEQQLAQQAKHQAMQHSGQLKQQAGQMAHQMQGNLRQPAQQAAKSVMLTTGESASALRHQGAAAAQHVQGQARESRDELR
jgi:ElaB/YqjD/DUF883 family membrane-anchored ribosome-binding protein